MKCGELRADLPRLSSLNVAAKDARHVGGGGGGGGGNFIQGLTP